MKTKNYGRLVLRRQPGQSFMLGKDIQIKVDSVDASYVTISIVAPRNMPILRTELIKNQIKD